VVIFPHVRIRRRSQALGRHASSLYAPKDGHEDYLATDPSKAIAKAYDMVLERLRNRRRLSAYPSRGSGSPRCSARLAIDAAEAKLKFGYLLDALQYGAPAPRRHCLRPGPHRGDDGGDRIDTRRDRLPEKRSGPSAC